MSNLIKNKYLTITAVLMLIATGSAEAQDKDTSTSFYVESSKSRCSTPCDKIEETCKPKCCKPCIDFTFCADLLYWRALQNGLECGCGPDIRNQWDIGYRLGLEYDIPCSKWNIAVYWTDFHSNSHQRGDDHKSANWSISYETIDIRLGRQFCRNSCFSYTPYIGLRAARIDEKLRAHFGDCCGDSEGSTTDQHHRQNFCGIGPEIGMDGEWMLKCGFSLYGSLGAGLLYGRYDLKVHDVEFIPDATDSGICCAGRDIDIVQPFVDAAIGIQWQRCLCNCMSLTLRVGLEHHGYFNHNQIGGYGDLSFDGAVFSACIYY